eukprot:CAMPEP_0119373428 /NCGR_PEP_ID=MMETSP1334-20130426/25641_1 /TAXON_ID=127549 /ORGANISM="Calcidiscus leptoporus, Strain RCC1130" /LENGTH=552 /DNA_ID=CAMNT_0007391213 /DNA_START=56 /DNA_END=1714 /DNA_ORIENTATION=-
MADLKLSPHATLTKGAPVVVAIIDGFGENKIKDQYNAVHTANTPTVDALRAVGSRFRSVAAHGPAVGLPSSDDMGNSEVGHNALGAGKIYAQGAKLVDINIASGQLFTDPGWAFIKPAFASNTLHFIGLLSDGGVHSRYNQLLAMVSQAAKEGAHKIRLHVLTDGRDVPDGSGAKFLADLEADLAALKELGCDARVASGGGRMKVTMDRYEADWPMVERGWKAHVLGDAPLKASSASEAYAILKQDGTSDQNIGAFVVVDDSGSAVGTIEDDDAVVISNFRSDRVIEISKAFEGGAEFNKFDRVRIPSVKFAGLMQYDGDLKLPTNFLVPPPAICKTSGEYLAANGLRTFACSETQKFGHVTFFWNGNRSGYFNEELETYVEIPSDNCLFNEKPEMKAREITDASIAALKSGRYDLLRVNYANPDMVGHTGDLAASITACEVSDSCLKRLLDAVDAAGGIYLVTSDHGNADDMVQRQKKTNAPVQDPNGANKPLTSHTLAPVPVFIGGKGLPAGVVLRDDQPEAGLANITATIINLLGFEAPADYEPSLLKA